MGFSNKKVTSTENAIVKKSADNIETKPLPLSKKTKKRLCERYIVNDMLAYFFSNKKLLSTNAELLIKYKNNINIIDITRS
jgi:hypothetical protein